MTVGTSLFSLLNTAAFQRLDTKISELQDQISTGKKDPRASIDPVRAQRLSVAKEQQVMLARFDENLNVAEKRLGLTDAALDESSNILQRVRQIAIRGSTDSVTAVERESLRSETLELRRALIDQANARDGTGRPLFGGFQGRNDPFVDGVNGVEYVGDGGIHSLKVSENASVATGIDGDTAFMSLITRSGEARDVFSVIDDLVYSLGSDALNLRDSVSTDDTMELRLTPTEGTSEWSLTLGEGDSAVTVTADLVGGQPGPAIAAINAVSADTGVTATFTDDGTGMVLTRAGGLTVSGIEVDPEMSSSVARAFVDGSDVYLVAPGRTTAGLLDDLASSVEHVANRRAEVGALGQSVERHMDSIANRQLIIKTATSGLEDLDLAEAITTLQRLMVTREASQSSFVKISQRSLFDYIG